MIDTIYPYWGPPSTIHAEFPLDLVLKNCPPDLKECMVRCMQWSKLDSDGWVERNSKEGERQLRGLEAETPPPAVLIHAKSYVPVENSKSGEKCMVDAFRDEKLGWDLFPHQFIAAVWDMQTHHFGLFDKDTVSANEIRCMLLTA